jgi:hypothetical protein
MKFRFAVDVEVSRLEGKFASREELAEQIQEALDSASPGSITGSEGGEYDVMDWSVNEEEVHKPRRATPAPTSTPAPSNEVTR